VSCRVSVVGLGKLGACMAASMAQKGMEVTGVDKNPKFVDLINDGRAPVTEPGLADLIAANRARLRATGDIGGAVGSSDITFVIVPTPSGESGAFVTTFVLDAMAGIGEALRSKNGYHLVVLTSTVMPGATQAEILPALEKASGRTCGRDFGFCYNPEFIALGSVIRDLLNPDFVLIGESDERAGNMLTEWYGGYCENNPPLARMSIVNAEITKISVNSFVTTKITFANTLAAICERFPGADVDAVSAALGRDSRIGSRYLKGALGYGGPCFPRDNLAFALAAESVGVTAPLAEATDRANRLLTAAHADWIRRSVKPGAVTAVLGLAYKPDTVVLEESASIALAKHLSDGGHRVLVHDPLALDAARAVLGDRVEYASLADCLARAQAVVIANPCEEYKALRPENFPRRTPPIAVLDCWRVLRAGLRSCTWVDYIPLGVGRGLDWPNRR
jgi:UDPglucose 6-dehydrogenase